MEGWRKEGALGARRGAARTPLPPYHRRAAPPPRGARGRPSLRTAAAALPSSRRGQWGKSHSLLSSFLPSLPLSATASAPRAARPLRSAGPRRARSGAERCGGFAAAARPGAEPPVPAPLSVAEPNRWRCAGGEGTAVRCRCAAASERWGRRGEVMAGGACAAQVGAHPRTCPLRAAACGYPCGRDVPRRAAVSSALPLDTAVPELSPCVRGGKMPPVAAVVPAGQGVLQRVQLCSELMDTRLSGNTVPPLRVRALTCGV